LLVIRPSGLFGEARTDVRCRAPSVNRLTYLVIALIMAGLARRRSLISDFAAWATHRDYERAEREEALGALALLGRRAWRPCALQTFPMDTGSFAICARAGAEALADAAR